MACGRNSGLEPTALESYASSVKMRDSLKVWGHRGCFLFELLIVR